MNKGLQLGLLATSLGYILLLLAVVSMALFAPLIVQIRRSETDSLAASEAALRLLYLHDVFWLPVLLTLAVICLHSVYSSHRIAGPVLRFSRVCESMARGTVPVSVRLRKHDHLQAEAVVVNAMLETWRRHVADTRREGASLHAALVAQREREADGSAGQATWDDMVSRCQRLQDVLARVDVERASGIGTRDAGSVGDLA